MTLVNGRAGSMTPLIASAVELDDPHPDDCCPRCGGHLSGGATRRTNGTVANFHATPTGDRCVVDCDDLYARRLSRELIRTGRISLGPPPSAAASTAADRSPPPPPRR